DDGNPTGAGIVEFSDNVMEYGRASWNIYVAKAGDGLVGELQFQGLRNWTGNHNYQHDEISSSSNDLNDATRSHVFRLSIGSDPDNLDTAIIANTTYDNSLVFNRVASGWSTFYGGGSGDG